MRGNDFRVRLEERINYDECDRLEEDLKGWIDYIPLDFIIYADNDYFKKCTKEALREYKQKRQGITGDEYLLNDILEWVEKYPQFKYMLKGE